MALNGAVGRPGGDHEVEDGGDSDDGDSDDGDRSDDDCVFAGQVQWQDLVVVNEALSI